jgi:hypothetical protein
VQRDLRVVNSIGAGLLRLGGPPRPLKIQPIKASKKTIPDAARRERFVQVLGELREA